MTGRIERFRGRPAINANFWDQYHIPRVAGRQPTPEPGNGLDGRKPVESDGPVDRYSRG